jgi:glycosyltransferase involved in cell wall biosynthesis
MLSVCIPVFNYDIRSLVHSLQEQGSLLGCPFEILLLDDASSRTFQELNRETATLPNVRYEELATNAGRSRIRNLLCHKASYHRLIFMDCDSATPDDQYLQRYLDATEEAVVVCGGRSYLPGAPNDDTYLHWWYGRHREVRPAAVRNHHPYQSFMTNNFMAPKSVMERIPFNESINGYGHEDTLFGYELKQQKVPVRHIDNPLLHIGLQSEQEFLGKTRQGIANLWKIHCLLGKPAGFAHMVRVLKTFNKLDRLGMSKLFCLVIDPFQKRMLQNLKSNKPRLHYLDLYKLRLLCQEASKK